MARRVDQESIAWEDLIRPDDSLQVLIGMLRLVEQEYTALGNTVKTNAAGMQRALKELKVASSTGGALSGMAQQAKDLKDQFLITQQWTKEMAEAQAAVSRISTEMLGQSNSVKTLTMALKDTVNAYNNLSLTEKNNSQTAQKYLNQITHLRVQLNETTKTLKTLSTVEREIDVEGKKYNATLLQISDSERKLIRQRIKREQQTKRAIKLEEAQAKMDAAKKGSYDRMAAEVERNKILLRQMNDEEYKLAEQEGGLVQRTNAIQMALRRRDEAIGNFSRNASHYSKVWSGFDYSVAQIVREVPNAAISVRTFIMALSNNFATLGDEIKAFKLEQEALRAEGMPTISVFKRLVQAVASWNTILMIGVTVFTAYGETWWKMIKSLFKGKETIDSVKEALEEINSQTKHAISGMGKNVASFQKLKEEWKGLANEDDMKKWLKDNEQAFKDLDISIRSISDADRVFANSTKDFVRVLSLRAQAMAVSRAAESKWEETIEKQLNVRSLKMEAIGSTYEKNKYASQAKLSTVEEVFGGETDTNYLQIILDNMGVTDFSASQYLEYRRSLDQWNYLRQRGMASMADAPTLRGLTSDVSTELNDRIIKMSKAVKAEKELLKDEEDIQKSYGQLQADLIKEERALRSSTGLKYWVSADKDKKDKTPKDSGKDLEEWLIQNEEKYRHRLSVATAKADEDDWDRQVGLITEKYEHERQELLKTRNYAQKILSGGVKIKGKMSQEQKQRLVDLIDKFPEIETELAKDQENELTTLHNKLQLKKLEHEKEIIDYRLKGIEKEGEAERALQIKRLEMERQIALQKNRMRPESERMSESDINANYDLLMNQLNYSFTKKKNETDLNIYKSGRESNKLGKINAKKMFGFNKRQQNIYDIETQQGELEKKQQALLDEYNSGTVGEDRKREISAELNSIHQQYAELGNKKSDYQGAKGVAGSIAEKGSVLGGLLDTFGMDDNAVEAVTTSFDSIKDSMSGLIDSYVKVAEAAVKSQEKQVEAAQKVVDAEAEASKNGYANSVATAQEELKLEKQKLEEQKRTRDRALKMQRAMDSAEAASSLTVALAKVWKSAMDYGIPAGPILGGVTTAGMIASFVASRIKAKQAAKIEAEYGEGGLEFLDGGSHASGNDIDLHTTNSDGRNMRAEGGEALAIINKRNTRKYRNILPGVIESLNKGVFEEKYLNAFERGANIHAQILAKPMYAGPDLSGLESKMDKLISQGNNRVMVLPDGSIVEQTGNVKRIIKKND